MVATDRDDVRVVTLIEDLLNLYQEKSGHDFAFLVHDNGLIMGHRRDLFTVEISRQYDVGDVLLAPDTLWWRPCPDDFLRLIASCTGGTRTWDAYDLTLMGDVLTATVPAPVHVRLGAVLR